MDIPGQIIPCILVILMFILGVDLSDISFADEGKQTASIFFCSPPLRGQDTLHSSPKEVHMKTTLIF